MSTLYVRNFPAELYKTIQEMADQDKRSISAEVIELVTDAVERQQLKRRRLAAMARIAARRPLFRHDDLDTLEMLHEDRSR